MTHLVIGASKSGKSEYAESLAMTAFSDAKKMESGDIKDEKLIYLATMKVFSAEDMEIVERHRRLRAGKGFTTIECEKDILSAFPKGKYEGATVLLECLSNLVANEFFDGSGGVNLAPDIDELSGRVRDLIIVSNNVFEDGCDYSEETVRYIRLLGELNTRLAETFDSVTEVVCGIPIKIKG